MICNTCQRRQTCLLPQLATSDKQLQTMLKSLKRCELQQLAVKQRLLLSTGKITQRVNDFSRWLKKLGDRRISHYRTH